MAVNVTQLDGQNVGLRLIAQTSVQPLSVHLRTGVVTSDYLTSDTCFVLRDFALKLFQTIPASARAGAAIGILQRLCAVSPADASVLTLTATVSANVATLNAAIDSSPGTLILTTPYAQSSAFMPASFIQGPPGPPPAPIDSGVVEVGCFNVPVGTLVYIDDLGDAEPADASDPAKMPCVGVVEEIVDATHAKVRVAGAFGQFSGLTPGKIYFVGEGGDLSLTPPVIEGHIVQAVGFSLTDSTLCVAPATTITVR